MKLYYFILYSFLTFSLGSYTIEKEKEQTFQLISENTYFFTIDIRWDDSIEIKLKMSRNYDDSNLDDLYYCFHSFSSFDASDLQKKQILSVSKSYSSTQTILNSKIDTSYYHTDYLTLIITSNKNLSITIYAKGRSEAEEKTKQTIFLLLLIPIGCCIIIIIGSITGIYYCCKPKKTVNASPSPVQPAQPLYPQPPNPQPLYPQQPNYQPPQAYIPPPQQQYNL